MDEHAILPESALVAAEGLWSQPEPLSPVTMVICREGERAVRKKKEIYREKRADTLKWDKSIEEMGQKNRDEVSVRWATLTQ